MNNISNDYFDWLCRSVSLGCPSRIESYSKLLHFLHNVDFVYSLSRDGNRYEDGINLRYYYGLDSNIPQSYITRTLDDRPCSVLEMMVGLARRCENQIMCDSEYGDRTGQWFWEMINSLGLIRMDNRRYNDSECRRVVSAFLMRRYKPTGEGGLFTVTHYDHGRLVDLTTQEIWYQAVWHLNDVLEKENKSEYQ